jgi:hypothetical protein
MEQRIEKSRKQEAKEADLKRLLVGNNIVLGHSKSETTVEAKRRNRIASTEQHELFTDYMFTKGKQDEERRRRIAHFEEEMANELQKRKADHLREEMHKRRICDGSEELRVLKERLHAAKVNRERAQQLCDLEVRKESDRVHEHRIAEHMENERISQTELEHKLTAEKERQRERVKNINQQQIAQKEASKQEALLEYMKEKEAVDSLVASIEKEDSMEAAAREEKKIESQQMLRAFMIEQKEKQRQLEQAEREEAEAIEKYARDKRAREEAVAAEKERIAKEKERIFLGQMKAAEMKNKAAGELENLRNDLHAETAEAEKRRREELQMRKKLEDREEMKNAYLYQMRLKEERRANAEGEDARMKEVLLKKFAEDDRLEQMNDRKRRLKLEEHKREANRLLELRQQMFDAQRAQERADEESLRAEEATRMQIIQEEKRRLLNEHGKPLKAFLPKYTFENPDDYEYVFGERPGALQA